MTDVELQALTALVNSNATTERNEVAVYGQLMTEPDRAPLRSLRNELERRGVIQPEPLTKPVEDDDIPY